MAAVLNILVCPLDWGLGHATRCIPVIHGLLKKGVNVVIAGSGRSHMLLKSEFPACTFVDFPGYRFVYPTSGNMIGAMLLSAPMILFGIVREHWALRKIINDYRINALFSDNRFGLWNRSVYTIYMTHQIRIRMPKYFHFLEPLICDLHKLVIRHFNRLWIPDNENEPWLAGELAHHVHLDNPFAYIGPLSRFSIPIPSQVAHMDHIEEDIDVLVLISGPEPQRSIFEQIVLQQVRSLAGKIVVLRGMPDAHAMPSESSVVCYNHLPAGELLTLIRRAKLVVSRPGYTTIMELAALGKNAFFIPTPGQTEQEYLACLYKEKGICYSIDQKSFNFKDAIDKAQHYKGFTAGGVSAILEDELDLLITTVR